MKHTYKVTGMTCGGCKTSVEKYLSEVKEVTSVTVDLEKGEAEVQMNSHVSSETLQKALPEKYMITEKVKEKHAIESISSDYMIEDSTSKLQQLKPLFLIIFYITTASILLNYKDWNWTGFMFDFMGLFYIVFSFFKFLDLKGFVVSFSMYDPLAKRMRVYGWIYPFIELALGFLFLLRIAIPEALVATLLILGITTIGVTRSLVRKQEIQCACLGTALKLPMTEATFIENAIMIVMAIMMLIPA